MEICQYVFIFYVAISSTFTQEKKETHAIKSLYNGKNGKYLNPSLSANGRSLFGQISEIIW